MQPPDSSSNKYSLRPIWLFLIASALLSWTVWLWPTHSTRTLEVVVFRQNVRFFYWNLTLVFGNCLPGLLAICWAPLEGKQHLKSIARSLTHWQVPLKWYIVAFALPCVIFLTSLDAIKFWFPSEGAFPPATEFFKTFLLTLPFGTLWEEIAWRAYVLRKLPSRYSRFASASIVGLYWAVWHVPLWIVTLQLNQHDRLPVLFAAALNLFAWSYIFAFLFNRTSQSLPITILLHGAYGAASQHVAAVDPQHNFYLILVLALVSVLVGALFAMRLRSGNSQNGLAEI